jgi:hypothetical protein
MINEIIYIMGFEILEQEFHIREQLLFNITIQM